MQGTRPSTWPPKGRRNDETVLGCALAGCFLLLSSGMLTLMGGARGDASDSRGDAGYAEDALRPAPARRAPQQSAAESRRIATPGAGAESKRPSGAASGPARPAGSFDLGVYRGLGAWVDQYDFGAAAPAAIVEGIARRGATTLYLQTGRWNLPEDVAGAAAVGAFLEASQLPRHQGGRLVPPRLRRPRPRSQKESRSAVVLDPLRPPFRRLRPRHRGCPGGGR